MFSINPEGFNPSEQEKIPLTPEARIEAEKAVAEQEKRGQQCESLEVEIFGGRNESKKYFEMPAEKPKTESEGRFSKLAQALREKRENIAEMRERAMKSLQIAIDEATFRGEIKPEAPQEANGM